MDFINTESEWIDNLCMDDENITVVENSENSEKSENLDDTVSAELFLCVNA